jgi:acetyltransferase-like isoleucine patch superfamily enzyme
VIKKVHLALKSRLIKFINLLYKFLIVKVLKKPHYIHIPASHLCINFIVQRIFKINSEIPFSVSYTTRIQGYKNIKLPKNDSSIKISMAVSGGCYFSIFQGAPLTIGENTIWAHNVCIQTGNHGLMNREDYKTAPISIGKNCWIGNSVTILPGVILGDNVTIGANSVVTKSFPSNVVIAGCPAKIIKEIV